MRGYLEGKEDVLKRLRRMEGQVRGLQKMVNDEEDCIDILTQVSAVTGALKKVAVHLLEDHIRHCVSQQEEDREDLIEQATAAIDRLVRS